MPGNRVVVYLRVSTEDQAEMYGLPSQRHACQKLAADRGWAIVRELTDDTSGKYIDRPGLNEVRRMVAAGEADVVLIYSVDRLSRINIDVLTLYAELQKSAIVEFATENFPDTPAGRLFLSLRASMGAYEREIILARTQTGRLRKAESGKIPGGRAPYGYRLVDGNLVIQEDEAAVVRQIYEWSAAGVSQRDIVRRLNEQGIKPYMAAKWGKTSVGRLIGHEVYVGTALYNARKRISKTLLRPRPVAEHKEIKVPPIVSREVYDTVVIARATNREMLVGRPSRDYMLSSILRCSCGKRMCGDDGLYRCTRRGLKDALPVECKTSVSARMLDEMVWDFFVGYFADPEKLRADVQRDMDLNRSKWESSSGARDSLTGRIEKLAAREKRMMDMMVE
jgi:site-specific DNA recombinase